VWAMLERSFISACSIWTMPLPRRSRRRSSAGRLLEAGSTMPSTPLLERSSVRKNIAPIWSARRSLDGGGWIENALPLLEEARRHLEERQRDDQAVLLAVDEKIGALHDDAESLAKAVRVRDLVGDC